MSATIESLLHEWTLPWPVMEVLIGGKSSIDLRRLTVRNWDEAGAFLRCYGFDPEVAADRRRLEAIKIEAVTFMEGHLLDREQGQARFVPEEVSQCTDVRQLLLWASERLKSGTRRRLWSCAVLRVMHTIAHIESNHGMTDLRRAVAQIRARFDSHLHRDADGSLWFGSGDRRVELDSMAWKEEKTRDSIITKLLHKRANVAETIYDLCGVRIVTKHLCDVLLVVKYLRDFYIVSFPNCNPGRARNTLLDVASAREKIDESLDQLSRRAIDEDRFVASLHEMGVRMQRTETTANPHSSVQYRAIQLTCRQLVRYPNPALGWMDPLRRSIDSMTHEHPGFGRIAQFLDEIRRANLDGSEITAFFPFEVQIMDAAAYRQNQFGDAAHDRYKRSQIRAARRRVFRELLAGGV